MQIKNKKNIIIYLISLIIFSFNVNSEEFDISAKEILVDKENEIVTGIGSVTAIDTSKRVINADKITYEKTREFLIFKQVFIVSKP